MKSFLVLSLCLASVSAHAETISQPCQFSGFVANPSYPVDLARVPTRPTLVLPLEPQSFASPPSLDLITVEVLDGDGVVVPGRVRAGAELSPYMTSPVWQPDAALPPGAYVLRYDVAAPSGGYPCMYAPIEGELRFVVVADEAPPPTLALSASFHDRVTFNGIGLSRSCGPNATPCAERPGLCCVHDGLQILRALELDATVTGFDSDRLAYYRVVFEATSVDQGLWSQAQGLEGGGSQVDHVTVAAFDAPAPGPGEGCATVTLIDMLMGGVVATATSCADPARYMREPDATCDIMCAEGDGPIEGVEIADPSGVETADPSGVIPDAMPGRSEGCAGGAAPGLGLVALLFVWRRVSTR